MTYIENIFACLAAPLVIAALCMGRSHLRFFLLGLAGMAACLLSAYINTFFAVACGADNLHAVTEITPVVEELMKMTPMMFYLLVFEPEPEKIRPALLIVATGFATFENICYLIENGAEDLSFLLIRGFGAGSMHIVCGAIVGCGVVYMWRNPWLKAAGTCALLGAAISFHAIYNVLVAAGGAVQYAAYVLPSVTMLLGLAFGKFLLPRMRQEERTDQ